jgi:hypothetical protein
MGRKGKAGGRVDVETMQRQQRCADLAIRGLSYTAIAEAEGYASESGARHAVSAVLSRADNGAAEELRPLMSARATELWRHGFEVMLEGRDAGDMDMFRTGAVVADRALARMMRLFGLDQAAMAVQMSGTVGDLEALKAQFLGALEPGVLDGEIVDDSGEAGR